ncbi:MULTISPECIES: hypothetical protein [Dyella]|uniref:Carboxypeptidase regulatory-like domain-containing protein n=2 Tax=Dyella TaxID=231454 RepID=A0A4R0YJ82_9GAMM|nr:MULTISPECIES: hypothetical protein [Dyella]TBR36156.1 hypothetical protein EYV96_16310 [Dyella terrae]TCI06205.1 hypothetical protein EZM97_35400 [Dyella soli]
MTQGKLRQLFCVAAVLLAGCAANSKEVRVHLINDDGGSPSFQQDVEVYSWKTKHIFTAVRYKVTEGHADENGYVSFELEPRGTYEFYYKPCQSASKSAFYVVSREQMKAAPSRTFDVPIHYSESGCTAIWPKDPRLAPVAPASRP